MTFPLTPTVIVFDLSPPDSDACTGTALPINLSNLESRPFLPRGLTQLRRIALDQRSRAQTNLCRYPHSAQPPAASFNPASMRSHSRPVLRARSPTRPHRTLKIPQSAR